MMRSPVLTLARDVADDVGLRRPDSLFAVYNEGDTTDVKLKRALIKTSRFLHRYWTWPLLTATVTFTSGANGPHPGVIPADFERFVPGTMRDMRNLMLVLGPIADIDRPSGLINPQMQPAFNMTGGVLTYSSPNPVGATVQFEYVKAVIAEAGPVRPGAGQPGYDESYPVAGTLMPAFRKDYDLALWDDELMHLGMVWAVLHRDGAANNEDYQAFASTLHERMTHESSGSNLSLTSPRTDIYENPYVGLYSNQEPWGQ